MLPSRALTLLLCFSALSSAAGALTFEEAEKAMLAANPQAASASLSLETARSRVAAARAGFYPSFSASASYSRSGSRGLPAGDSYGYGFSGSQPLFSPSVPAALSSAKASLRMTEAAYDRTASGLRFQLKSAFADILNARETLKLSGETLKRRAENLELIRLKYQAGRENKAALLETEAVLKTAQWQHERYRKNLRLLERKLNRLLGRPAQSPAPELQLAPPPPRPKTSPYSRGALKITTPCARRAPRSIPPPLRWPGQKARSCRTPPLREATAGPARTGRPRSTAGRSGRA